MKKNTYKKAAYAVLLAGAVLSTLGCSNCNWCTNYKWCEWAKKPPRTTPLGTQSDQIWRQQEAGASASDFVMYQHEFELNGLRLNMAGEDHLKSIAVRLRAGACLPVVIERSMTSVDPRSEYKFPVNPSSELDMQRREVVVKQLSAMGVQNAEQCVVVAPAIADGYSGTESIRAYHRGLTSTTHRQRNVGEPWANSGEPLTAGMVALP